MYPAVQVSERGAARIRSGHPWVYGPDVAEHSDEQSDVVRVVDGRSRILGTALYAPAARLALRMLSRQEVTLDRALLTARIGAARDRRRLIFPTADAYRVVHGEADRLPGLIVDRYADVAVLQTLTRAMDAREPELAELVGELLGARLVVARNDGGARDAEALPRRKSILLGKGPTTVAYHDSASRFEVDVLLDGKTGGFLDQAENHLRATHYARGDALDAFSYHGGFALALARGGARSVLALDESAPAVERARVAVAANGLEQVTVEQHNAFDALRNFEAEGRQFDTIVLDPPALAKRKSGMAPAERAYKELNLRGLRLLRPEGILITCSCSGKLTPTHFGELLESAARDVGRPVQLLERRSAGRDHPSLLGVPETDYLKCFILKVIE